MRILQRLLCVCLSVSLLTASIPAFVLEDTGRSVQDTTQKAMVYKDVTAIEVYQQEGQKAVLQKSLPVNGTAEDYLVLVKMKELPGFYANVKEVVLEEGKLYLDLDCPETGDGKLKVLFGVV